MNRNCQFCKFIMQTDKPAVNYVGYQYCSDEHVMFDHEGNKEMRKKIQEIANKYMMADGVDDRKKYAKQLKALHVAVQV